MRRKLLKRYGLLMAVYAILALIFFYVGDDQIKYRTKETVWGEAVGVLPEISEGNVYVQSFKANTDSLKKISLQFATYARENRGEVFLSVKEKGKDTELASIRLDASQLVDGGIYEIPFNDQLENVKGKVFELTITSGCFAGSAPTLYYRETPLDGGVAINGVIMPYELYYCVSGYDTTLLGAYYWVIVIVFGIVITSYFWWSEYQRRHGKLTIITLIVGVWRKYRFLIKQLVARDFKTKYKRSVLGYLWSFLNPLLTMAVQYIVFSTIFRSGIENFPVYLLSGIIMFNFFTEAVGQGLMAIIQNSSLITKVYLPKYIYPLTKVISSSTNLLISIIPLIIVVLITKTSITKALILLPFVLLCLILFCMGMSLALSSAMVFFRDTQYLWGIISMIWMYATPLFYPESIVPKEFKFIQTMNPMYHMITFIRTLLIKGVSPDPLEYAYCLGFALVSCLVGAFIFKKTQDKFVLYI